MAEKVETLINKIVELRNVIELSIPSEVTVLFNSADAQPFETVWSSDELQILKDKMLELVGKL